MTAKNIESSIFAYAMETRSLDLHPSSTENTFYPAIKTLLTAVLHDQRLPFEVRVNTSETRSTSRDMPDFVLGDDKMFVGVYGEVKRALTSLEEMAASTQQNDQIGRYLAQTGVVLLSNVRGFGLLTCVPGYERATSATVPPSKRALIKSVDLWSAVSGTKVDAVAAAALLEIVDRSVTDYATVADPASLAKILARQARDAKEGIPEDLKPVKPLLDDYRQALGLSFNIDDEKGDRFFRSSLVQTAFYSLFAAWVLWDKADKQARSEDEAQGRKSRPETSFNIDDARTHLPIRFLEALLHDLRHPTRLKALGLEVHLDRAVATLNRVNRPLFRARMTFPTIDEQTAAAAITYFYEPFLEAFDPQLRDELGVWYTPPEVVRYQVRRVHHLLKTELGILRGLADPNVVVLDPCCGTGAYLLEVARCIADEAKLDGDESVIGLTLSRAFHERVIGFEILTAPFAIAQLQLYLLLDSLGGEPDSSKRLMIFLTNSLSGWRDRGDVKLTFPEMREEFDASQEVKRKAKIIVVIGNPPYDRFAGAALAEELELVAHYKGIELVDDLDTKTKRVKVDEFGNQKKKQRGQSALYLEYGVRKQLLDDLYVRFFRLAEERIGEAAEFGLVSYISNSSYLTGRSHPIMRKSLLSNFQDAWIDNLNGDKYRTGKQVPEGLPGAGTSDQSVFSTEMDPRGIQPGTAIITLMKRAGATADPTKTAVRYRDFWGLAKDKRAGLLRALPAGTDDLTVPYSTIRPTAENRWRLSPTMTEGGFEAWPALDELFPVAYQGVNHNRGLDGGIIGYSRREIEQRLEGYFTSKSFEEAAFAYPEIAAERARYEPKTTWQELKSEGHFKAEAVLSFLAFPLDQRHIYYVDHHKWLNEARPELAANIQSNELFITVPEPRKVSEALPVFSTTLPNLHVHERGSVAFPREITEAFSAERYANLSDGVWKVAGQHFGLTAFDPNSDRRLTVSRDSFAAREFVGNLFRIGFAVLHAPAYQTEHRSALSADWAHLPIPKDRQLFDRLVFKGEQVTRLLDASRDARDVIEAVLGRERTATLGPLRRDDGGHLRDDDLKISVTYWGGGKGRWKARPFLIEEAPRDIWGEMAWGERTGDLYINDGASFSNVPEAVWTYQLGGYPVLKKWLGYRQADRRNGDALSDDERQSFRQMIQRIAALLAMGVELDALYQEAAGDAFAASDLGIER